MLSYIQSDPEVEEDERFTILKDFDIDTLSEILGYNYDSGDFLQEGIGFLESERGFEVKELLEILKYDLKENIIDGVHGHDTTGVIYLE